ncbi:MAG: M23 family metallopeptidase [Clostridia bacterium]|nr:M23 family metallopeptidase [Clostridia bacterium]
MNIKKIIISVLCVIALFIPTYLAIANYAMTKDDPVSAQRVDRMEIADPQGEIFKFAASDGGNDIVALFDEMSNTAVKRDELPAQLVGHPFYKVTYYTGKKSVDYKYYFSADAHNCYFVDDMGSVYQIEQAQAQKFVSTPYALALYNTSSVPSLVSTDGQTIAPNTVSWSYRAANGSFIERNNLTTETETLTYSMEGGIDLNFSVAPDALNVKVYDGGTLIYEGSYANISTIDLSESKTLSLHLDANWYEDSTRDYYGHATYQFKADIVAPAEFYLGRSEIEPGDFVVLTGINVADISKITFSAEPSINYTPKFFADGKYVHALIPISYELEHKAYTFTIGYGITSQTINLSIADKTFGTHNYEISTTLVNAHRTPATIAAFENTMRDVYAVADSTHYWSGVFLDYRVNDVMGGILVTGFGRYRTIKATGETYRMTGVDFYTYGSVDVPAVNNGRVIYVGMTDLTGKTIVIEHGYGLKSWYSHLGETSVNVGDTVTTGQVIGKTGSTGFFSATGVNMGLTVYDVPVSPYPLWDFGVEMYFEK